MTAKLIGSILIALFLSAVLHTPAIAQSADPVMDAGEFMRRFRDAKDVEEMGELVREAPQLVSGIVITLAREGMREVAGGQDGTIFLGLARAIAYLYAKQFNKDGLFVLVETYRDYSPEFANEKLRGDELYAKGASLFNEEGKVEEALQSFREAAELSDSISDIDGKADALLGIGSIHRHRKRYDEALDHYHEALDIKRSLGDDARVAFLLEEIGVIHHAQHRYRDSLEHFEQAAAIYGTLRMQPKEAEVLGAIGLSYEKQNQNAKALEWYYKALETNRRIPDETREARSLETIGLLHGKLGQYMEALNFHQQAFEIDQRIRNESGKAADLRNMAGIYQFLGQRRKARKAFQQAVEIYRRIEDESGEGSTLANLAYTYQQLGQFVQALDALERSLEIAQRTKDFEAQAGTLINLGVFYVATGRYKESLGVFKQGLEISRLNGLVRFELMARSNTGYVYGRLRKYDKAIEELRIALKLKEQVGGFQATATQIALGKVLWKSGQNEQAGHLFEKAIESIEVMYNNNQNFQEEARAGLFDEWRSVYRMYVDLLLELHRQYPTKGYDRHAFVVSEKAKSRIFLELMAKVGAQTVFVGDTAFQQMVQKERQLIAEIARLRQRLAKESSKLGENRNRELVRSLEARLTKVEQGLRVHRQTIDNTYPRYADFKRPQPLYVEGLQVILRPDETLLSYVVGEDKVAAFVIGKNHFKLVELEVRRYELINLVKQFRQGLDRVETADGRKEDVTEPRDLEQFDPAIAYTLYQEIFQPVIEELRGGTWLYLSADDLLYTLPFEALVDRAVDSQTFEEAKHGQESYLNEYGTLHYLIDTYTITYLPSSSVLRSLRKYEKPGYGRWQKPLIAFADPIFSQNDGREEDKKSQMNKATKQKGISKKTALAAELVMRSTGNTELERLKDSADEARAIAQEVGGEEMDIYLGEDATEENVHIADLKTAQYVLFSTHGLLGGDLSGAAEPALVLTLVGNPPERDGFLTMSEVLGLDLNAELTILSACNTAGRGEKAGNGEGFAGLTRSFMYAGTRSLLVTHWKVESRAARDLMVAFFKARKKAAPPEALREAKLKMKDSTQPLEYVPGGKLSRAHPFFWAPFVLIGHGKST